MLNLKDNIIRLAKSDARQHLSYMENEMPKGFAIYLSRFLMQYGAKQIGSYLTKNNINLLNNLPHSSKEFSSNNYPNKVIIPEKKLFVVENLFYLGSLSLTRIGEWNDALKTLPLANVHCTFRNYHPETDSQKEALKLAKNFCNSNSHQKVIVFYGNYGAGKSHLATAMLKEEASNGRKIMPTYRTSNFKEIFKEHSAYTDWLVDDLEIKKDIRLNYLDDMIRKIETKGGSLIVTTNVDEYHAIFKDKMYDRLCAFGANILEVTGRTREERFQKRGKINVPLELRVRELEEKLSRLENK